MIFIKDVKFYLIEKKNDVIFIIAIYGYGITLYSSSDWVFDSW